ncbi:MAG: MGH1-like glycoside hydrolase domain-containing protein [Terriglobales bacterium]
MVRPPQGVLPYTYLIPGAHYFQLFDWDTYFMGVALSYQHRGRALADSVRDFLHFTDLRAGYRGYTPREIGPEGPWALPEMCKPFLAQMALRASQTRGSAAWLRPDWQRLKDTLSYWRNARQTPDGLFTWFDGVESGVDNSPAVPRFPADRVEGVDLACYLVREYRAMAVLAKMLDQPADARLYAARARRLTQRIQTRLWSAKDGTFYDRDSRTGRFIRVPEWTNLVPLWARVATPDQARVMIQRYALNPKEFWSPYGIRSLAPESPDYDPAHGYWRGPVWIISNYMVMHGLMNYGYSAPAQTLARRTVQLLLRDFQTTGGMHECYDPRNGQGLSQGHFVSWDLLGAHMISEADTGDNPTAIPVH